MDPKTFRFWNLLTGWVIFLAAFLTYYLTMEPTVSWWDCGEFIAAAAKLEVGHPPGAPLFMLIGRAFAMLAGESADVARMVNLVSVLASAFTVLFLFWTITHFARKNIGWNARLSLVNLMSILGSGVIGALVFTFSDSFWFSAVEGEVYALSSLFTAVVFWAILKWENEADQSHALRWIILIAYLMGLSIGIHLLNLLAIPAIVFIYYFKQYTPTTKGVLLAFFGSFLLVIVIMYGIIPGVVLMASWFELFFVNLIGLPFNTGAVFFVVLLTAAVAFGIIRTRQRMQVLWNTVLLAFAVMLIGYGSYAVILIRSNANPPMEQNNPDEVFRLIKYLNREQYGDRPLLHGQYYSAPVLEAKPGKPTYTRINGRYEITDRAQIPVYDPRFTTLFPRMWHNSPEHIRSYQEWARIKGVQIPVTDGNGETTQRTRPTFAENMRFFFSYQLGHMYFRYFMWNFAGRQDDEQSHGGIQHGNWLSGIPFIDDARLGPQDNIPDRAKNHKARNTYFLLPLLLGLAGGIWQYRRGKPDFWVVMLLFIYTGVAIVVYLNQWPNQPRERDYAYAGSYYAFAIWAGLGAIGLVETILRGLAKKRPAVKPAGGVAITMALLIAMLFVPMRMATQNWDDHDRSNRYLTLEFARNYLESCAPNAILFTNGDNDTFPLWYAQEVEGIRTDVRVMCLPYLSADWYIEQMTRQVYDSEPVPFSLTPDQYRMGNRDYIPVLERVNQRVGLKELVAFVASDNPQTKVPLRDGSSLDFIPTRQISLPVDRQKVMQNGTVRPEDQDLIVPAIEWDLQQGALGKNDLMILDLIAQNDWERPIYFTSIIHQHINGLHDYFQLEGLAYRLVPIKTASQGGRVPHIPADLLYERLVKQFEWGNMEDPDTWVDFYTQRTSMILRLRHNYKLLADQLHTEGKTAQAIEVLDHIMHIMPKEQFPYQVFMAGIAASYYACGEAEKANTLVKDYSGELFQDLDHYLSLDPDMGGSVAAGAQQAVSLLGNLIQLTQDYEQFQLAEELEARIGRIIGDQ